MQEKVKKIEGIPEKGKYRVWFRCTNCGTIFQFDMHNGHPVSEMTGPCPYCGCKSGSPKTGVFPVVKYNPERDQPERHYFR